MNVSFSLKLRFLFAAMLAAHGKGIFLSNLKLIGETGDIIVAGVSAVVSRSTM
jgi:hypothetical protein